MKRDNIRKQISLTQVDQDNSIANLRYLLQKKFSEKEICEIFDHIDGIPTMDINLINKSVLRNMSTKDVLALILESVTCDMKKLPLLINHPISTVKRIAKGRLHLGK